MNNDELFIEDKLPLPLSKEEVSKLFQETNEGSKEARDKLIIHNIRLVLYLVTSKFKNVNYDKKDLVSIGNIGLIKAIDSYDLSKGFEFTTYASRCINNEILGFLKKLKKDQSIDSIDSVMFYNKDGQEMKLEDKLSDDNDLVEDYVNEETHKIIREVVKELPNNRDKEIIMLYFGFYDDKTYTQKEIADKFNICRAYVSRIVKKVVKKVGKILESKEVIELHSKQKKVKKKEPQEEMKKLQTIYEYFNNYTREQINVMLTKLTEEERALVTARYGEDLNNSSTAKLTRAQTDKFYGTLVPTMKKLLANPNEERKQRKPKQKKENIQKAAVEKTTSVIKETPAYQSIITEQIEKEVITTKSKPIQSVTKIQNDNGEISKEDYIKMSKLLRTPTFTQMMGTLSVKESVIISLKLGYIDGKYFSTESIAQFLEIEETEVIETTKKILLVYKESINNFLDTAIEIVTKETEQERVLPKNPQNTRNS